MKVVVLFLFALVSFSSFAAWTEVECSGQTSTGNFQVAIDEGFGPGSLRHARVYAPNNTRDYTVMGRGAFGNRVRYEAAGFDLEVDFWPDVRPQWGRTYRGNFTSTDMQIPYSMMWCRFPNIRP